MFGMLRKSFGVNIALNSLGYDVSTLDPSYEAVRYSACS